MYTVNIPTDKVLAEKTFYIDNKGWSDFELFTRLLDKISNEILMTDVLSIEPAYFYHQGATHSLVMVVKYLTY
jgi:hypothetical protein